MGSAATIGAGSRGWNLHGRAGTRSGTRRAPWAARLAAALALGLALLAQAPPLTAGAGNDGLTLTVSRRWGQPEDTGSWSPFLATVRNDTPGTFDGDVLLVPDGSNGSGGPIGPIYRSHVTVPNGSSRDVVIFAIESSGSYHAELHDDQDQTLLTANPGYIATNTGPTVAVLSDTPNATGLIDGALRSSTDLTVGLTSFASTHAFPTDATQLAGLNAIVIDDFDSGSLSPDQLRALSDFVALGGSLVVVGGPSWRRTLGPLPRQLVPMVPEVEATASLSNMATLASQTSAPAVQIAFGSAASWAKTAITDTTGWPLVAEGAFGAGWVVELTFDPLAQPVANDTSTSAFVWAQALTRALSGTQGPAQSNQPSFKGGPPSGTFLGSGPGAGAATGIADGPVGSILSRETNQTIRGPDTDLIIWLMLGYVIVITFASYGVLRALHRPGLLWVTVPAFGLAATVVAYAVGFGSRGSDFRLIQVQVQRWGPGGVVAADTYQAAISPRRSDIRITFPSGSLVASDLEGGYFGYQSNSAGVQPQVTEGTLPTMLLPNVPIWDARTFTTLRVMHLESEAGAATEPLQATLQLSKGHVQGELVNHTGHRLRSIQLLSSSGRMAVVADELPVGGTMSVDASLGLGPAVSSGYPPTPPLYPGGASGLTASELGSLAVADGTREPGQLVLAGLTDPDEPPIVNGGRPAVSAQAMFVEPILLDSSDTITGVTAAARLVATARSSGTSNQDVYEISLPAGHTGAIVLSQTPLSVGGYMLQPGAASFQVFDWSASRWVPISLTSNPTPLSPAETSSGKIWIRATENQIGGSIITAFDG